MIPGAPEESQMMVSWLPTQSSEEPLIENDLFQLALNIQHPWFIDRIEFDPKKKHLDIWIDFLPGSDFVCPVCNRPDCKAYDTSEKIWRHLNFFQHKCYLHCRVPWIPGNP